MVDDYWPALHGLLYVVFFFFWFGSTDLQFSTDEDEEFEEVVGEVESVAATLGQGESLSRSSQPVKYKPGKAASGRPPSFNDMVFGAFMLSVCKCVFRIE